MPPRATRSSGRAGRPAAGADVAAAPAPAAASSEDAAASELDPSQLGSASGSANGVPAPQPSPDDGAGEADLFPSARTDLARSLATCLTTQLYIVPTGIPRIRGGS
eukprot:COSAG02_NODE_2670_length_8288_cov_6.629792_6_plen_106_part_00